MAMSTLRKLRRQPDPRHEIQLGISLNMLACKDAIVDDTGVIETFADKDARAAYMDTANRRNRRKTQ